MRPSRCGGSKAGSRRSRLSRRTSHLPGVVRCLLVFPVRGWFVPDDEEDKSPLGRLNWAKPNHDRYRKSRKHEERIAAALGGKRLPNSGAKMRSKYSKVGKASNVSFRGEKLDSEFERITLNGDISQRNFHIEHKSTERESLSIKVEWLDKVSDGAASAGTIPALVITYVSKRVGVPPKDWVLIPFDLFQKTWKTD